MCHCWSNWWNRNQIETEELITNIIDDHDVNENEISDGPLVAQGTEQITEMPVCREAVYYVYTYCVCIIIMLDTYYNSFYK